MKYKQKLFRLFRPPYDTHGAPEDAMLVSREIGQCVSADLHGTIASGLALLRMQLYDLKRKAGGEDLISSIDAMSQNVDELIRDTREMIWTFQPGKGLENTVDFIGECFYARVTSAGMEAELIHPPVLPDVEVPVMLRRCLVRCMKEATDLIVSNSTGTKAGFYVDVTDESIRVRLRDDSIRGRLSNEECSRRLAGLTRMIEMAGGACSLFSSQSGTTVWFQIPMPNF